MSLYIYLKHGCCPRTACSVTFPGASGYAPPWRGVLPAEHLCGSSALAAHSTSLLSRVGPVPLMSCVVIRPVPWWTTCRGLGGGACCCLISRVFPVCPGARLEQTQARVSLFTAFSAGWQMRPPLQPAPDRSARGWWLWTPAALLRGVPPRGVGDLGVKKSDPHLQRFNLQATGP